MRVLTICHDHPSFTSGGTENLAHDLTRTLNEFENVDARFLAVTTSLTDPDAAPGSLRALGEDYLLRTGTYDAFTMRRCDGTTWIASLEQLLTHTRPDVVHVHGLDRLGADALALIHRVCPQTRIVLTLHDYQLMCPRGGLLLRSDGDRLCQTPSADACRTCFPQIHTGRHAMRKMHLQALLAHVDMFIAPSQFLRDRFIAWGLDPARVRVIPNAVPSWTTGTPRKPRAAPNRFAFFGNLAAHKGIHVLLDAAARLSEADVPLSVTLHGTRHHPSPEERQKFDAALTAAGRLVTASGPYDRADIPSLMSQTDWVIVPSLWYENAPLVVLEAQRAGLPVICAAQGGLKELVTDNVNGLHVPRGNPSALAEMMQEVAHDQDLWRRLRVGIQPPLSLDVHARRHLALFQDIKEPALA